MTDLPMLKIGCGRLHEIPLVGKEFCGQYSDLGRTRWLCQTCRHNLDAVKAHAAVYNEKYLEVVRLPEKYNKPTPDFYVANLNYEKGARDAVLGLLPKELKEKVEV